MSLLFIHIYLIHVFYCVLSTPDLNLVLHWGLYLYWH